LIPDGKRIVADYLREDARVASFTSSVRTTSPSDTSHAWVKITQISALQAPEDPTDHLIEFVLQFDCYAGKMGGPPEAADLSYAVRDALVALRGSQNGAVVTAARILEHSDLPDETFEPERERMIVTSSVFMHS
jgi:hypothetical protein